MPLDHPFGEASTEQEISLLKDRYQDYYYNHAPFNEEVLLDDRYLIVGRRGSGKTSLLHYFGFQNSMEATAILVTSEDLPHLYGEILDHYPDSTTSEIMIPQIGKLWEAALWSKIFMALGDKHPDIHFVARIEESESGLLGLLKNLARCLLKKVVGDDGTIFSSAEALLESQPFEKARTAVLDLVSEHPVILAIDSLEHHDLQDSVIMQTLAALVETASKFNLSYAYRGLHIKLCITDEIFPHLIEEVIRNPGKTIRNPVYLHWRPKDLLRLICWRYCRHLEREGSGYCKISSVDWSKYADVKTNVWDKFFSNSLQNKNGVSEHTYPYVFRHTQMKPREVITYCNRMAEKAHNSYDFPYFTGPNIVSAIEEIGKELSSQVLNSYNKIHENVSHIVDAVVGFPLVFIGNQLDKAAKRSAASWPEGQYSLQAFRQILCEIGMIGRVRRSDSRYIEADFEYFMKDRLVVHEDTECTVHPMFIEKFNIKTDARQIVFPFPNHPDYKELHE